MTRTKSKPPIRKPVFEEEGTLRFASGDTAPVDASACQSTVSAPKVNPAAKNSEQERLSLHLMLRPEVIVRLEEEAARRGKPVGRVVEKLVAKHLGKH
jgi:hypothetical protein